MSTISKTLIEDLDNRAFDAIERVEKGAASASASLTVTVKRNKDGEVVAAYSLKGGSARKGEWYPPAQARLDFDVTRPDPAADRLAERNGISAGDTVTWETRSGETVTGMVANADEEGVSVDRDGRVVFLPWGTSGLRAVAH